MATKKPGPVLPRFVRTGQIEIKCERGPNKNKDLAPGKQAYALDRLLVLVDPDAVRRPNLARPLGLPPVVMKALAGLKASHGLTRVETIITPGHPFYLRPTDRALDRTAQLTKDDIAALSSLAWPPRAGEIPLASDSPARIPEDAAVEIASRIELIFSDPAKVQGAAQTLCRVPHIKHVERPALGFASPVGVQPPPVPQSDQFLRVVPAYTYGWWKNMTDWASLAQPDQIINNIAVLDSGIQPEHPCLPADAVAYPDGGDFPFLKEDIYGHGTHVASIVAGRDVPNSNFSGGALPTARITSFRIFNGDGTVSMTKLKTALFAIRRYYKHIKVINLSIWMLSLPDWDLREEFRKLNESGVVICVCAGNKFSDPFDPDDLCADSEYRVLYPARLAGVLSVGATNKESERAGFSRFSTRGKSGWDGNDYLALSEGRWPLVDLLAPGQSIWAAMSTKVSADLQTKDLSKSGSVSNISAKSGWNYAWLDGTSMATPLVAAAAGYLRHHLPHATSLEIRNLLRQCVDATHIPKVIAYSKVTFPVDTSELHGTGVLDFGKVAAIAKNAQSQ